MKTKISFFGGVGAVTGANFLLDIPIKNKNLKIVVDCGLLQGVRNADGFNYQEFVYNPKDVDVLIVTHAHADHIGRICKLVRDGFSGKIYSTPATFDLVKVMFEDQLGLITKDALNKNIKPMYERQDVNKTLSLWSTVPYHQNFILENEINVYFKDSGHILGSAIVEISRNNNKIVFTGDLGNSPSLFLKDTEIVNDANYIVMESVYGDRNHEPKDKRREKLKSVIENTIKERRTLVIPVFSLERTQDILYEINYLVENKEIEPIPVFVDSPLGIKVTDIYKKWTDEFKEEVKRKIKEGDDIFDFSKLKMVTKMSDSNDIQDVSGPKIIMAGSGMSSGGRIVFHEKRFLPDPKATFLFVGYQSVGTLGRMIQDGNKKVNIYGEEIVVRARIESIYGYSSHKDSDNLLSFVEDSASKLKCVFVTMGEFKSSTFLAQRIKEYLNIKAICPELNSEYLIDL